MRIANKRLLQARISFPRQLGLRDRSLDWSGFGQPNIYPEPEDWLEELYSRYIRNWIVFLSPFIIFEGAQEVVREE